MADSSVQNETHDSNDTISALPDHLLCKILSFLSVKEAAAHSILSTRWRYIFASIPDISLEFTGAPAPEIMEEFYGIKDLASQEHSRIFNFLSFGNRLFRLRNGAPIRKFEISFFHEVPKEFKSAIDSWVIAAVSCRVQELTIWSGYQITEHTIRSTIFTCRTLVSLKLYNSSNDVRLNGICLPLLKVLHLDVRLDDEDSLPGLVRGCPLLEELDLDVRSRNDVSEQLSRSGIWRCKTLVAFRLLLHYTPFPVLPADSVYLPNLKVFCFKRFELSPDKESGLQRFINSCPMLEEFHLNGLDFHKYPSDILAIESSSLKFLSLIPMRMPERDMYTVIIESTSLECLVYQGGGDNRLIVKAPNLRYFDYSGDLQRVEFPLGLRFPYSASISVESDFKERTERNSPRIQRAFELISDLQAAKSLWLSDLTLEALYHCPHPLPTLNNLTSLKLEIREGSGAKAKRWWEMLPRLFASAPNLEELVMEKVCWKTWIRDAEFERLVPVYLPVHFIERLREIKIEAFDKFDNEYVLAEYILQHGKALKKFTISALPPNHNRILSLKKCSKDCQIVFDCGKHPDVSSTAAGRLESEGVKTFFPAA